MLRGIAFGLGLLTVFSCGSVMIMQHPATEEDLGAVAHALELRLAASLPAPRPRKIASPLCSRPLGGIASECRLRSEPRALCTGEPSAACYRVRLR